LFQENNACKTPPDFASIWRYTTWGRLCDILVRRALFFARATTFNDPWEGSFPEEQFDPDRVEESWAHTAPFNEKTRAELHQRLLAHRDNMEANRHTNAVSCWHMSGEESDSHWRIYGHSDEGVAIRSSVGHLKKALEMFKERSVFIGQVEYGGDNIKIDSGFRPIVHKRSAFRHDQEVRAIVWEQESEPGGRPKPTFGEKGTYVDIDVGTLVQEVVVSPLAHMHFVETVTHVIRGLGLSCPVRRSTLLDPPTYRKPGVGS
jgi:hypothetical protein